MKTTNQQSAPKKIFCFGAIFLLAYVILDIVLCIMLWGTSPSYFHLALLTALVVATLMKKNGYAVLIPCALLFFRALYYATVSLFFYSFSIVSWLNVLILACLVLISLPNIGLSKFKKAQDMCLLLNLFLPYIAAFIYIRNLDPFDDALQVPLVVFYYGALFLIGLWVFNPNSTRGKTAKELLAEKRARSQSPTSTPTAHISDSATEPPSPTKQSEPSLTTDSKYYIPLGQHILLFIVTIGIWLLVWTYRFTAFLSTVKGEEPRSPINQLLLNIFIPFYWIYWTYTSAKAVDRLAKRSGIESDLGTICLVLCILLPILPLPQLLMQNKLNQVLSSSVNTTEQTSAKAVEAPSQQQASTPSIVEPVASPSERLCAALNDFAALEKYKELFDKGVITAEEFEAKKKQILGL